MAVNVWARLTRKESQDAILGATLALKEAGGEETKIRMTPVDGEFDSPTEDVVATIDTFAWVRAESHELEIQAQAGDRAPVIVGAATIRVKPRIATPDLFLFDDLGGAYPWIGTGAGGFAPVAPLETGSISGRPRIANLDKDQLLDVVVPTRRGQVLIYRNRGRGRFVESSSLGCPPELVEAVVGDLNGDAKPDLVTISRDRSLEIRLAMSQRPIQSTVLTLIPDDLELADLDGNGEPEICLSLLGLDVGDVQVWTKTAGSKPSWTPTIRLDPGGHGRGRIRDLLAAPDTLSGRDLLLILSATDGNGVLECWGLGADTDSEPGACARVKVPGEPLRILKARLTAGARLSWLVVVREGQGTTLYEVKKGQPPHRLVAFDTPPIDLVALDLDADGDDDLVTAAEELRIWINVQGGSFHEAGESPYPLETPIVALVAGSFDEKAP
jgi:hypothetical protein